VIQAPGPEAASAAAGKKAKSLLPLIVALSMIGALTIAIVAYFVFAK
jgi:flagellar basal body-associated protein FliL